MEAFYSNTQDDLPCPVYQGKMYIVVTCESYPLPFFCVRLVNNLFKVSTCGASVFVM